jgi:hypothetical protein
VADRCCGNIRTTLEAQLYMRVLVLPELEVVGPQREVRGVRRDGIDHFALLGDAGVDLVEEDVLVLVDVAEVSVSGSNSRPWLSSRTTWLVVSVMASSPMLVKVKSTMTKLPLLVSP